LRTVEQSSGVPAQDPGLVALKRIFVRRLREIEQSRKGIPPLPDWTRGHRALRNLGSIG
jgi:hypothetical protein